MHHRFAQQFLVAAELWGTEKALLSLQQVVVCSAVTRALLGERYRKAAVHTSFLDLSSLRGTIHGKFTLVLIAWVHHIAEDGCSCSADSV